MYYNKIYLYFLITSIFYSGISFGQKEKNKDGVYELVKEATEFNYLGLGLHILSIDANKYNCPIMVGGEGFFSTNFIYGGYRILIGEGLAETPGVNEYVGSVYGKGQGILTQSFYGGIPIFRKIKKEDVEITVGVEGNTRYYVIVPANVKKSYCLDFGYDIGITPYIGPANKFTGVPYGTTTPIELESLGNGNSNLFTKYDYGILRIGGAITTQHSTHVKTEKFGGGSSTTYIRKYANFTFPIRAVLDDMLVPTYNNAYYRYELDGHTEISKVGFNIGFSFMEPDRLGTVFFGEIGYFPGPKMGFVNNLYLKFGGGFSFSKILGLVF